MDTEERIEYLDDLHADCDAPGAHPAGWNRRAWAMRDLQGVHILSTPATWAPAASEPIPFED